MAAAKKTAKAASKTARKTAAKAKTARATPARTTPVAKAASTALAVKAPAAAKKPAAGSDKAKKADDKVKKPKLVRDSFTIPKMEYAVLDALKQRAARLGRPAKKSEVLRAGVKALEGMTDEAFLASMGAVPAIKTGRPAKA